MFASRFILALAATALATALPALAQTPSDSGDEQLVATARAAKLPTKAEIAQADAAAKAVTPAARPLTTEEQIQAFLTHAPETASIDRDSDGSLWPSASTGKRQIHGSAGVSIGTNGYRSAYVTSIIPIGDNGTLGIAISKTENEPYGYAYGYAPFDYGYSPGYAPGYGHGHRRGSSSSVALSFDMSNGTNGSSVPDGCAPGFRDGGRNVEPLWVNDLHGRRDCLTVDDR